MRRVYKFVKIVPIEPTFHPNKNRTVMLDLFGVKFLPHTKFCGNMDATPEQLDASAEQFAEDINIALSKNVRFQRRKKS